MIEFGIFCPDATFRERKGAVKVLSPVGAGVVPGSSCRLVAAAALLSAVFFLGGGEQAADLLTVADCARILRSCKDTGIMQGYKESCKDTKTHARILQ